MIRALLLVFVVSCAGVHTPPSSPPAPLGAGEPSPSPPPTDSGRADPAKEDGLIARDRSLENNTLVEPRRLLVQSPDAPAVTSSQGEHPEQRANTPAGTAGAGQVKAAGVEVEKSSNVNVDAERNQCHGFGLLTPLFGVSSRGVDRTNPNRRDELRITGPVESGIGGGYYRALGPDNSAACTHDVIIDGEVFGFSEGLNPSTTFQIGVGAGIGVTAWGKFQFGISLGYDLIRRETISNGGVSRTYSNGLLEWNDVTGCGTAWGGSGAARCAARNFTWLLTFGVTSASGDDDKPKASRSGGTSGRDGAGASAQ